MRKVWWIFAVLMVLTTFIHYINDQTAIEQCLQAGGSYHYDDDFCSKKDIYEGETGFISNHTGLVVMLLLSVVFGIASIWITPPQQRKKLLMVDNYDSFTYNLVQYFGQLGLDVMVKRNDELSIEEVKELKPHYIVISPGPCTPNESGISLKIIEELASDYPILGVCLGHQAMAQVFGGKIIQAKQVMHGKTSPIYHENKGVFKGLPNPLEATRYHSLVVDTPTLPEEFEVTAWTEDEEGELEYVMGIKHKTLKLEGVQFHPESILSEKGHQLLKNFIEENKPQ
ncbi:Glutamine amidotransferase of anthranilate synthase [Kangiella sediminilitoris]|uniref:Glutamine amidotransferase of anthranilate synthase n=2 Tax=Kangiella sediminilitoris TaxID=1144748 RepID=A0A1B3B7Q8_9GAMM|nr:Glutamine amidotransferase of anthranilate synthase [Kangiella sediminilitoris]